MIEDFKKSYKNTLLEGMIESGSSLGSFGIVNLVGMIAIHRLSSIGS